MVALTPTLSKREREDKANLRGVNIETRQCLVSIFLYISAYNYSVLIP